MTISYASGSFDVPGAPGNQSITGLGFTPSLVIFYGYGKSSTLGSQADAVQLVGAASSASERWATSRFGKNNGFTGAGTYVVARTNTSVKCISYQDNSSMVLEADFVSMDADGFTIDWTSIDNSKMFYLAIGGIQAYCGSFLTNAVIGNQSITGVGFIPTGILLKGTDTIGSGIGGTAVHDDMGAATSVTDKWHTNDFEFPNVPVTIPDVYFGSALCYSSWGNADIHYQSDFVSMDADGFTINCTNTNGNQTTINYIAVAGIDVAVGNFVSGTMGADIVVSGLGFKPGALLITSMDFITENLQQTPIQRSIGGGVDATHRSWAFYRALVGGEATPSQDFSNAGENGIVAFGDSTASITQRLDIKTMDDDGFTLKVALDDNISRRCYYAAFGSPPINKHGGSTLPCVGAG